MLATQNRIVFLDYLRVDSASLDSARHLDHGGDHIYGLGHYGTSFAQGARSREMDLLKAVGIIIRP